MGNNTTGMADIVMQIIREGQLTMEQEDTVRRLLTERAHMQGCRSLAGYIVRESSKAADLKADEIKEMYDRLYRYCIKESSIGNMDVSELSEAEIRKFIVMTAKLYELDRKSWYIFLSVLQAALNAMAREGVLGFEPPKRMHLDYLEIAKRSRGVEIPYEDDKLERIMQWLEENPEDVRGLAIALWLEGGISAEEITDLKTSDLLDSNGRCSRNPIVVKKNASEDYLLLTTKRGNIIRAALELHPDKEQEYIFMVDNKGELEKLPRTSLPSKMVSICRQVGVQYKCFKCTDRIL